MDLGICLMIVGGWFELQWMYNGTLFGFMYGACVLSDKFKVLSKKLTVWWFIYIYIHIYTYIYSLFKTNNYNFSLHGVSRLKAIIRRIITRTLKQLLCTPFSYHVAMCTLNNRTLY